MKFALLCSGSKGNSFYIENEGTKILIDCGSTKKYLMSSLDKLGVAIEDLDALLITHDHSDHISQIRFFESVPIYSPVEIEGIESFYVRPLQKFTVGSMMITPLPLSHDAWNTMGYVVETGNEKLVYITDTGYINRKLEKYISCADYYVMECNHDVDMLMRTSRPQYLKQRICSDEGHLNNEDCGAALAQYMGKNTRVVFLAHISQQADTREKALETVCRILKESNRQFNERLYIAAAGQFEMIWKGEDDEEIYPGSVYCTADLEPCSDNNSRQSHQ